MDRATQLDLTTRIIASRIPGGQPDAVKVLITEALPGGGSHAWEGSPRGLAGCIQVALESAAATPDLAPYTIPVGVRRNRNTDPEHPVNDLWEALAAAYGPERAEGLIGAYYGALAIGPAPADSPLAQAEDAKTARDLPGEIDALMAGDAALHAAPWYPLRPGDLVHIAFERIGDIDPWGETYRIDQGTEADQLWMRLLHHSPTGDEDLKELAGAYAGCYDEPLYDAWFEAGPQRITVVRDGAVIPNTAA